MKIWVVRQTSTYDQETYVTTHITEKGALMTAIETVREDMTSGFCEEELEDYRPGMPHNPEEDLMGYDRKQLQGIVQDWWEYAWQINDELQYQIYETVVTT